jgi:hypothetical protein
MKKSKLALGSVALGLLLGACAQRPADPTGAVMQDQATGLQVPIYKPTAHYDAVKDKWIGTTPPPD